MNTPDQRVVGHRVIRKDSAIKVTGEAIYAGDIKMPGMLYGKALRSQYPHAKILSIDTSAAEAIEGVHCVMTARDLPGINRFGLAILDRPGRGQGPHDGRLRCLRRSGIRGTL